MLEELYKAKSNYTISVVIFMLIISAILYFADHKRLKRKNNLKEAKVAKFISYLYCFGSVIIYILFQVYL